MAKNDFSKKLKLWMDELPISDQPLYKIIELLKDPTLPASLRVELLLGSARFFSAIYSSSKTELSGSVETKQATISRQQVLESLHAAGVKSPADLQAVLEGRKPLLLSEGTDNARAE